LAKFSGFRQRQEVWNLDVEDQSFVFTELGKATPPQTCVMGTVLSPAHANYAEVIMT
jgi:hypothetical protein